MIIKDKLTIAKSYLKIVRELKSRIRDPRDFEDYVLRGAIERYLHLVLEAVIDVGMRFASLLKLSRPGRYRDIAKIFKDYGVLSSEESKRLESWIGLRNILVHAYAEIKYDELFKVLQEVEELERIIDKIYEYTTSKSIDPREKILESILNIIKEVLEKRSDIVFAYVFGSYATGEFREDSDIDVAVYAKRPLGWREHVELMHELEDRLSKRVDVVDLWIAPLLLAYEVVSKGLVVVDRDSEERINFEIRIMKEYLDMRPRLEKYYDEVFSK